MAITGSASQTVALFDYAELASCIAGPATSPADAPAGSQGYCLSQYDLDANGYVDLYDYSLWLDNYVPQAEPYSIQMHLHGPFSEGSGSIASHTHQALNVGVDVLWWSDHDSIMTSYNTVSTFSFDDWTEPIHQNETWNLIRSHEVNKVKEWLPDQSSGFATTQATISPSRAIEGEKSLRLEGMSNAVDFAKFNYRFFAFRSKQKYPLANVISIDVAIFPEAMGVNARAAIDVGMSYHPPGADLPFTRHFLHYYLDNNPTAVAFRDGDTYHIPLAYIAGVWNTYCLPITEDSVVGFRFTNGEDNSLVQVNIGIESRNGTTATAYFDDFRIKHVLSGDASYRKQRAMLDLMQSENSRVVQMQGVELGYDSWHLNEFSVGTVVPDYDQLAQLSGYIDPLTGLLSPYGRFWNWMAVHLVDAAHARGGVVSYTHPFGTEEVGGTATLTKERLKQKLIANRAYGADLLEVGYRDRGGHGMADHLWVWDEIAKSGRYMVGVGVSDLHGSFESKWVVYPNNLVSWVYTHAATKVHIIDALKRGRVYFGDIVIFDGTIDLVTSTGFSMGQMVVTDKTSERVTFRADGIAIGDTIKIIEYGTETQSFVATDAVFDQTLTVEIDPVDGTFVRMEVYDSTGKEKAFSNPIYLLPGVPSSGIDDFRAGIDVGGCVSTKIRRFMLTNVQFAGQRMGGELMVSGSADNGVMLFDCSAIGAPNEVVFNGLSGSWTYHSGILKLFSLDGTGGFSVLFK